MDAQVLSLALIATLVGGIPLMAVALTSFVKISVVFFILRNAIGIQQTPPNIVLYALTIILTAFVSQPVISDVAIVMSEVDFDITSAQQFGDLFAEVMEPVKQTLLERTTAEDRQFYIAAASEVWGDTDAASLRDDNILVLVPTFMTSELTQAFKLGFLLYLPFLVVDLVVSAVLMALGMIMMSPTIIAVPFKLALFVIVDGWTLVVQGLILSYVVP